MRERGQLVSDVDNRMSVSRKHGHEARMEGKPMVEWIRRVFIRELTALARQVEAYVEDDDLWKPVPGIINTGGTLVLHLAGNLQYFIGAQLGGTGYIRDREAEFSVRGLGRSDLLAAVEETRRAVETGLANVTDESLGEIYPIAVGDTRLAVGQLLCHLVSHFAYHLGQIDYHRRVVTGQGSLPGMLSARALE